MRAPVLLLALVLLPVAAYAQAPAADTEATSANGIQELPPSKPPKLEPTLSDRSGAVALRGGLFKPDNILGNTPGAGIRFEDVYGGSSAAMFAIDWEWQPLHHKYIGNLGIGVGAGYSRKKGKALKEDLTQSKQETALLLIPATADITYRMELWSDQPFVPYGGAGLDYWYFSEGKVDDADTTGGKRGWHWRAGGQLLLDFFEPTAAGQLDTNWGINNTYIYGEYRSIKMNGLGKPQTGFDFSDNTWFAGLLFEY